MTGIYKITSPTGRIYIGQSVDVENRFREYKRLKCERQVRLYSSLKKYGVEKHSFEIIEECDFEQLNVRERYWQDYYDVLSKNGLNCVKQRTDVLPSVVSYETRIKQSINRKGKRSGKTHQNYGKKRPKEVVEKLKKSLIEYHKTVDTSGANNPFYGRKHTEETKEKIRLANSGEKSPMYGKRGKECHNYGRKLTQEHKDKIVRRGSDHYFYGKTHSEETKRKISESKKGTQTLSKNPSAKKVINIHTKKIYGCLKEVSIEICVNYDALRHRVKKPGYEFQYLYTS